MSIYRYNDKFNRHSYSNLYRVVPKSGSRDDILEWLIRTDFVPNYITKLEYNASDVDLEDIIQEVWLMICNITQEKWDFLYEQGYTAVKAFVSGLIYRSIHSQNSPIYTKYKKRYKNEVKLSRECWDIYEQTNTMPPTLFEKDNL